MTGRQSLTLPVKITKMMTGKQCAKIINGSFGTRQICALHKFAGIKEGMVIKMKILKEMTKIRKEHNEEGALVIEATFVFPIMFFIIFFLILMGNMYYLKAKIDSVVSQEAIRYASYYADPMQKGIVDEDFAIPEDVSGTDNETSYLYRYLLGETVEEADEDALTEKIEDTGFFSDMTPVDIDIEEHKFRNWIIYQTYVVEISYKLQFPIKFIFQDENISLDMNSKDEVPVIDTPEFIRNVDMAVDYAEHTEVYSAGAAKYTEVYQKVHDFIAGDSGDGGDDGDGGGDDD